MAEYGIMAFAALMEAPRLFQRGFRSSLSRNPPRQRRWMEDYQASRTPEQRSQSARHAANCRWAKWREQQAGQ